MIDLPLWVSVMASAILSVALLFLALRESAWCWFATVTAILMIWRGESWKADALEAEAQVRELQSQRQALVLRHIESAYSSQRFPSDDVRCVQQRSLLPFLVGEFEEGNRYALSDGQIQLEGCELCKGYHNAPATLQSSDPAGYLALLSAEPSLRKRGLRPRSQQDFSTLLLEKP